MKNQVTVSINQPLKFEKKDYGSFYLSGSWSDYWASGQNHSNYSIGYSNSASWGSYSVSAQRSWNEDGDTDDSVYLSFTIPIEKLLGTEQRTSGFQSIDTQMSSDFKGNNQLNVSSSGYSDNARLSYSVNTGYTMNKASKDLSYVGVMPAMNHRGEPWQVQFLQIAITVVKCLSAPTVVLYCIAAA